MTMTISNVSVPFPPSPDVGDTYSIWRFDGLYWLLIYDEEAGEGAKTWKDLKEKPDSISRLGNDNEVDSGGYQPVKGIPADKAPDSWDKNK